MTSKSPELAPKPFSSIFGGGKGEEKRDRGGGERSETGEPGEPPAPLAVGAEQPEEQEVAVAVDR